MGVVRSEEVVFNQTTFISKFKRSSFTVCVFMYLKVQKVNQKHQDRNDSGVIPVEVSKLRFENVVPRDKYFEN